MRVHVMRPFHFALPALALLLPALALAQQPQRPSPAQQPAPAQQQPAQQQQTPAQRQIGRDAPPPAEQVLAPELPGYVLATQDVKEDRRVYEFLPKGQTLENWTERMAIVVFLGVTGKDPKQVAETLQTEWKASCTKFSSHPLEKKFEKGYPTTIFAMQCGGTKPAPGKLANEFVMAKVIQGIDSLYLVQRAWHSATETVPPPLRDTATGDQWANFIRGVEVCDARLRGQPCAALGIR